MTVAAAGDELLVVVLQPKQEYYEEIAVSANRGEENFSPVSVATSVIQPSDNVAPPTDLTEMVSQVPSVSENGQGGLFQTYSIRGVSRQRVLTLVSGMRIVSDRRAGTSGSFVDPQLMGSVDVLRGPSSTTGDRVRWVGSSRSFHVVSTTGRLPPAMDRRVTSGIWPRVGAKGGWSAGCGPTGRPGDSETPAGETLNSAFKQTSGTVLGSWSSGRATNTTYRRSPRRRSRYRQSPTRTSPSAPPSTRKRTTCWCGLPCGPKPTGASTPGVHPNDLETHVLETEISESTVDNSAFDLGLNWQKQIQIGPKVMTRFGLDYFGRRSVNADEMTEDLGQWRSARGRRPSMTGRKTRRLPMVRSSGTGGAP